MTVMVKPLTGALPTITKWELINWETIQAKVHRLQVRIAKATREGRHGKAKALQWLLTHSLHAKLLAVKRVVQNKGGKTPGVDRIIWRTSNQKMKAALSLQRRGYKTQPLRRVYIEKKKGGLRPLSIPPMICRAMQALYLLALEPIAEMIADKNSYGFRPKRSTADAIGQCFNALAKKSSAQWIFEADIKSCFDKISFSWLKDNIPMDKKLLEKWLTAGYIDQNGFHQTTEGISQGSILSPTLLIMTLSGLEQTVKSQISERRDKVNLSIYADDFIATGATKEVLETKVKPAVEAFLKERGLELSTEKTKITHIDEGFDFLGINIRKYKGRLIMKPSKASVKSFLYKVKHTIKSNLAAKTEALIHQLNLQIRGWANYMRHVCAKKTFNYIDHRIFHFLWQWAKRRHPTKGQKWRKKKYFRNHKNLNWVFSTKVRTTQGKEEYLDLANAKSTQIKRHTKIKAEATPYDPEFMEYFKARERNKTKHPIEKEKVECTNAHYIGQDAGSR